MSSIVSLLVSVPIDTYFWGIQYDIRYRTDPGKIFVMWPELYSFYFNGLENKSSEWGVSPWHWYFLVAIPKGVTCAVVFALFSLRKNLTIIGPVMIFVGIFSVLPHKELRFIIPSFTLINLAGATGLAQL